MNDCPICHSEPALIHKLYGKLPGIRCRDKRRANNSLPSHPVEMVGDQIKQERKQFAKSTIQPFRNDGTFSDEYYQAYGTKGVKVTKEQIKNRKKTWDRVVSPNFDITKSK